MSGILTGPVGSVTILGTDGHVDGRGVLTLDEIEAVARDHIEVGIDDGVGTLYIGATSLTALGGSATTRSSENVIRADLISEEVAICSTGLLSHTGLRKIRCRMYADEPDSAVRMEYRIGDGRWTSGAWKYPTADQWSDMAMGEINVPSGKQFEIRIVAKHATVAGADFDVAAVIPFPGKYYAVLRNPAFEVTPTAYSAFSKFDTESGAITGDSLQIGGTWSGSGDADDFSVAAGVASRSAVSDSAGIQNGRLIRASTPTLAAVTAEVDVTMTGANTSGLLLRYTDTSNFLAVYCDITNAGNQKVFIVKRVAGVTTALVTPPVQPTLSHADFRLRVTVDAAGNVTATWTQRNWDGAGNDRVLQVVEAQDSVLATGGTLASGKVGILDHQPNAFAGARSYDNFKAWVPEINAVVYANGSVEHRWDAAERERAALDGVLGRVPSFEGKRLYIPPAGREGLTYRLAVKANRNDVDDGLAANTFATLGDRLRATLKARGRVLLTGVSDPGS